MHEVEKIVGLHAVLSHQPAHRGAVAPVVVLLQPKGFAVRNLEVVRDVVPNALVHLLPEVEVVGIERVVEIEDPGLDVVESALCAVSGGRFCHYPGVRRRHAGKGAADTRSGPAFDRISASIVSIRLSTASITKRE